MNKNTTVHALLAATLWFGTLSLHAQDLYDINRINRIDISFPTSDWDHKLDSLYTLGESYRLVGSARLNGVFFDSIGVRYKGNSTYRPENTKNPLNIKLDYVKKDQLYEGYGTLKLSNGFKDPSFVREVLSYEIARKYMPASKANFINVYINGQYIGLYTSVQSVDEYFLASHFQDNDGSFFKGELLREPPPYGCPDGPVKVWGYLGSQVSCYYNFYEKKSDSGWDELIGFCDTLNNVPEEVEQVLDVDRHLWMLAFDNLLVNLDAPINFAHNFYLYEDENSRFNPIVWDFNECFGAFINLLGVPPRPPLSPYELQHLSPFLNLTNPNFPIINKILPIPEYKKQYIAHYRTILEENFSNNSYLTRAKELQKIIDTWVQADHNKFYSYQDFLDNLHQAAGPPDRPIIGLEELMKERSSYINSYSSFLLNPPQIDEVTVTPAGIAPGMEVCITARVDDATNVQLATRNTRGGVFVKTQMFDDGNHHDQAPGDHIYGITLTMGTEMIHYYLYAENDNAAAFSPRRAEYEYHTLQPAGRVVINEFMAVNDQTAADQDGEYDDWIELYNNDSLAVSLKGYHLSDNIDNPVKWTFPDTVIRGGGYLIVWADKDTTQTGLHASFKLSGSGESILLSDTVGNIFDQYFFGLQSADISTGRYPNGTGAYATMAPTFSRENDNALTVITPGQESKTQGFSLGQNYPNPFRSVTIIPYTLPAPCHVNIEIYNLQGRKIITLVSAQQAAAGYEVTWYAGDQPPGIYICRMITNTGFSQTRKLMILNQ